ncbi:MAG: glycogen-debranching protein, partial [Calditrichales bacterium]
MKDSWQAMSKQKSSGDARTILIVSDGRPEPLGVTPTAKGFNFAIYATRPQILSLLVQSNNTPGRASEIQLCKTGDVWHIELTGLPENFAYVYKSVPKYHNIQNPVHILNDPYAKSFLPGMMTDALATPPPLRNSAFYSGSYDWEDDIHPAIPLSETILYELHVKGFTRHSSAQVKTPGTFSGLIEKIPYLKSLGITTVELLPINEFVESLVTRHNPDSGEKLVNFWGYDTLGFFAPKRSYATDNPDQDPATAFKDMIKSFHRAGLEVILDIVFNHTGEGPKNGPVFSFRGLSPNTYYQIENPSRKNRNFSGCGNTVNCNHPIVIKMIMDVLRYWVTEMHVDGFRFDLASILTRGSNGEPLAQPPLIQAINADPVLSSSKLIAEAWDAAGLYQVGQFPGGKRWAEWNDKFRDDLRRFVRGDNGMFPRLATRIAGSSDLFRHDDRSPLNSINFVTCHDGFTMMDLNSYKNKRNRINGENNRDGMGENFSFDYGVEGPTPDAEIIKLRQKQVKNLITLLLLAQGVPMFLAGDEFGRSQNGN